MDKENNVIWKNLKLITPGKPMTEMEYENMLNESRKSKSYTLKEAIQYLNVRLNS